VLLGWVPTKEQKVFSRVRKAGNSLAVTIPKEEADRLGLHEGDQVVIQVNKVRQQIELRPHVRAAFEKVRREQAAGIEYLKDK
jgi:AbrB family looped-hinge helix DNA binding protein